MDKESVLTKISLITLVLWSITREKDKVNIVGLMEAATMVTGNTTEWKD